MLGEVDARRRNQRDAVNGYAGECENFIVVVNARHEKRRRGKEMTRANGRTVGQAQQFIPTHAPSILERKQYIQFHGDWTCRSPLWTCCEANKHTILVQGNVCSVKGSHTHLPDSDHT